jgi:hypothetical protein
MAFPDGQQALIEKVMTQNPASAGFFVEATIAGSMK